ncbi:saccharopine dehydrogenase family protein [Vibrio parahaemolyticus]|uniref:saccharopine dehydrogenase family protein n=1 Tax=Vibrio parahaemolyticus TaxID=670 RepID=UPI001558383B|nr:saccharopine dehydrogenase NADP-binding domain-containing protein [Vibrio parahaemolyticus]
MKDNTPASSPERWIIYGANGYTGELIAREAVKRGHHPILAGRSLEKVQSLAAELELQSLAFSLEDKSSAVQHISGSSLVLNCAGPFSSTAKPMMKACLEAGAHYLDITGEISVFEFAQTLQSQAKEASVVLCSGVGFDVIPTDCIAATLKAALPDATHLSLGFDSRSGFSPGTAKTSVEGLAQGGKVRLNGKITTVPLAYKVRNIDFGDGEKLAMTIPWGDVSTAYYTTGIENIDVFIPGSPNMIKNAKRANWVRPLLGITWVQNLIKSRIERTVKGPNEEQRNQLPTYVWGKASNKLGQSKTARVQTANGYSLTVTGSLAIVEHLLHTKPEAGVYTPSKLMGSNFVSQLPGSSGITIEE